LAGVFAGFATIVAVIGLGHLLAAIKLVDASAQQLLTRLSFFVALPCLMLTVMARTPVSLVLSARLAATAGGILLAALPYILIARLRWRRRADDIAIGAMCSAYTNAGNLGLPVAAYVLGDASLIAPMLLLHLMVLQPAAIAVLDAGRTGRISPAGLVRSVLTNPLTIGTFIGVVISATGSTLPGFVGSPITLVAGMAVPSVLIAYGASLRLGPLPGRGAPPAELALVTGLKLVAQPLGAYLAGRALGLDEPALLALAVTGALPCANNIFVLATRFGRGELLARDATFITTIGTVPVIVLITALLS
jgi:malonate transporter and related proteins